MKNRIQMIISILVVVMMVASITTACAEPVKITETPVTIAQTPIANEMQKPTPELSHEIAVDPTSKPTPKPTLRLTPRPTPMPTAKTMDYIQYAKDYCKKYGLGYSDDYAQNFRYAKDSKISDWNVNPLMPSVLYTYPYNCGLLEYTGKDYLATNKQMLASWSPGDINLLVQSTIDLMALTATANYKKLNGYRNKLLYYYDPHTNAYKIGVDEWIQSIKSNKIIQASKFVTDRSLVYVNSSEGAMVRGRLFRKIQSAGNYCLNWNLVMYGVKENVWYYRDLELYMYTPNQKRNDESMHSKFVVDSDFALTNWIEATSTDLALIQ